MVKMPASTFTSEQLATTAIDQTYFNHEGLHE